MIPTSDDEAALRARRRERFWVLAGAAGLLVSVLAAMVDGAGLVERRAALWRPFVGLLGEGLALVAWWQLGPRIRRPLVAVAIWATALLASLPLHSRDAFSYAAQGWLLSHGQDPYVTPSGEAGMAGLLVGVHWFRTTSVYPPLSLEIFRAVSTLFDGHLLLSVLGMRLPNLLSMAFLAWCLPRLGAKVGMDRRTVLWAGLLNPVVIVQWVGGIHNDAVMVALLAGAFLMAQDPRARGWVGALLGGAGIGLAMSIKQSAAVAGLGAVALTWAVSRSRRGGWRALIGRAGAAGAAALATFVAVSLASGLGFGWRNKTAGSPLEATSNAPISWLGSFLRYRQMASDEWVISTLTTVSSVLVLAGLVWVVLRWGPRPPRPVGNPWAVAVGSLMVFALLGPALQPWYLTWAWPFVALARPSKRWQHAWLLTTVVACLLPSLQDRWGGYIAMIVLFLPAWWLWRRLRRTDLPVLPEPTPVA